MAAILSSETFWTFVAAVAAWAAAVFSQRSSRTAADASQATLYLRFQQQYAGDEMWQDLRNLRSWKELPHGEDFASKWARLYRQNDETALAVDKSRRRVSHFFDAIAVLYDKHLLSEDVAKLLTRFQGIDLFFDVVEPLEKALNSDYDKSSFDILYALNPASGRGQPRRFRPTIETRSSDQKRGQHHQRSIGPRHGMTGATPDQDYRLAEAAAVKAIASGSQHRTMSAISHRIARSRSDRRR